MKRGLQERDCGDETTALLRPNMNAARPDSESGIHRGGERANLLRYVFSLSTDSGCTTPTSVRCWKNAGERATAAAGTTATSFSAAITVSMPWCGSHAALHGTAPLAVGRRSDARCALEALTEPGAPDAAAAAAAAVAAAFAVLALLPFAPAFDVALPPAALADDAEPAAAAAAPTEKKPSRSSVATTCDGCVASSMENVTAAFTWAGDGALDRADTTRSYSSRATLRRRS